MARRFFRVPTGRTLHQFGVGPWDTSLLFGEKIHRTRSPVHHFRKKRQKAREKRLKEEAKKASKTKVVDTARIAAMRQKRASRK